MRFSYRHPRVPLSGIHHNDNYGFPPTTAGMTLVFLLFTFSPCAWARYQAALVKDYTGRHQDEYITQLDRVRLLARQAQVEVSARLGLIQYREGFEYPL